MKLLVEFKCIIRPPVDVCGGIIMSEIIGNRFILLCPKFSYYQRTYTEILSGCTWIIHKFPGNRVGYAGKLFPWEEDMQFWFYPVSLSDSHRAFSRQGADDGFLWSGFHPAACFPAGLSGIPRQQRYGIPVSISGSAENKTPEMYQKESIRFYAWCGFMPQKKIYLYNINSILQPVWCFRMAKLMCMGIKGYIRTLFVCCFCTYFYPYCL